MYFAPQVFVLATQISNARRTACYATGWEFYISVHGLRSNQHDYSPNGVMPFLILFQMADTKIKVDNMRDGKRFQIGTGIHGKKYSVRNFVWTKVKYREVMKLTKNFKENIQNLSCNLIALIYVTTLVRSIN